MDELVRLTASDFDPPIETIEPARLSSPLVFSSPHSGATYPERFLAASRLDPLTLRRSEDAFVDELFLPCVALGAPLLRAKFPRAYLDVNREPYELDPKVFEGNVPDYANTNSLRVAVGLGTIPGSWATPSPSTDSRSPSRRVSARIEALYSPYHEGLRALVDARPSTVRPRGSPRLSLDAEQRRRRGRSGHRARRSIRRERRRRALSGPSRRACAARDTGSDETSRSRADSSRSTSGLRTGGFTRFRSKSRGRSIWTSAASSRTRDGPCCATIFSPPRRRWRANSAKGPEAEPPRCGIAGDDASRAAKKEAAMRRPSV